MTGQPLGTTRQAAARQDFPVLSQQVAGRPVVYLDSAATSLRPTTVLAAMQRYNAEIGGSIHRGKHLLSELASEMYEAVRSQTAEFLGAHTAEVVFVRNTTEAINLVAAGLMLEEHDLVVATLDAHHSNLLPWRVRARMELVPVGSDGAVDLDAFELALRDRPAVVALTACSNVTGIYAPVRELTELAKSAGAVVVVDAAQAVPHRRDILRETGADFLAFSGHKMLGPTGVGILCGRFDALERLQPPMLGGGTVDWVDLDGHRLRKVPHRFEYGTPDIAAVIGFGAALSYLDEVGPQALVDHDRAMARALLAECAQRDRVRLVGDDPGLDRAGLVSLELVGAPRLDDVARALSDSHGVMCRSGHLCAQPLVDRLAHGQVLRISTYVYNSAQDVAAAFAALDDVLAIL